MKKRILASFLLLCMIVSILPSNAWAANAFEFNYENGKRVGIKSIVLRNIDHDITYYDIYNGDPSGSTNTRDNIKFLQDVLKQGDNTYGGVSAIDYWSQLAYLIFADNTSHTALINASGSFEDNFAKRPNDGGYMDLVADLQRTTSDGRADGGDKTSWTGLAYTTSLNKLPDIMAKSITDGIGRRVTAKQLLDNTGAWDSTKQESDALKFLKEESEGPVFYSMVTGVDRLGAGPEYVYDSFGIAFYDFKLSVIADSGLQYISALEGEGSAKEAAAKGVPGVTYEEVGNTNGVLSYYTNAASKPSDVAMEFTQENTTEMSTSFTTSEAYSFSTMIGSDTLIGTGATSPVKVEETIKVSFTAEQVFSTAYTDTKKVAQTTTNKVSTNINLPAHSAIGIESSDGTINVSLDYDCPVAVTYKVAIFSLSGKCWDDNIATSNFTTSQHTQKHFCSVFGNDTGNARSDLYNRVFAYRNTGGYDAATQSTYGYSDKRNDGKSATTVHSLNWDSILGLVTKEELATDYTINCYEVEIDGTDVNGEDRYVLKEPVNQISSTVYPNGGIANYDNVIKAPDLSSDNWGLVKSVVYQKNGSNYEVYDSNSFNEGGNTRVEELTNNPSLNIVDFYYIDSPVPPAPASGQMGNSPNLDVSLFATGKKAASATKATADTDNLAKWLCQHQPLSATGGTLKYSSRSMNANINDIIALYPLESVRVDSGPVYYDMIEDDVLDIGDIVIGGYNGSDVPYYGFNSKYGKWIVVDENDNELRNSDIASLTTNSKTGRTTLTAGSEEGTVYLKYIINDKTYKSHQGGDYADNDNIDTAYIEIINSAAPFTGTIEANGDLIGYEGESVNLHASPDVECFVFDGTGKEINAAVTWEKKYLNGLTINGATLTFDKEGDYQIRATYRDSYSDWLDVKVLEARKLKELNISKDKTNLLDDYVLDDGANTFDLSLLDISAEDQYGNVWSISAADVTWHCDKGAINGSVLTVDEEGVHTIWAESSGGIKSNELELLVKPVKAVKTIKISGNIPTLDVNPNVASHTYDLDNLTVEAKDQYGRDIIPVGAVWEIVNGDKYATISGSNITGQIQGSGAVRLVYNGNLYSNEIPFSVQALAYVNELYQSETSDFVVEGTEYDLNNVILTAKDQWGGAYSLSNAQIASIVWAKSAVTPGTVDSADVTLAGSKLDVATGAVGYGGTGTVVLNATLPDRGDGQSSDAITVTLHIRQAPVVDGLTIALATNNPLRMGENVLVSEFFTVSALDQYGDNFPITTDDVVWASDNVSAYTISTINKNLVISAIDEDEEANITASIDVTKYDNNNSAIETVTSNAISMKVPAPRRVSSISVSNAPAAVGFGSKLNVNTLTPVVYDADGIAFTSTELAAYPASIEYTIEHGGTGTTFDASKGVISFGNTRGTVTVIAMVVNNNSSELASTTVNIEVGPTVKSIAPSSATMSSNGGSNTITLTGISLTDGITVSAFDSTGAVVGAISGLTTGNDTKQTVALTFPQNTSTSDNVVYTLKFSFDGVVYDNALTTAVTVSKKSSGGGGGGGGGGGSAKLTVKFDTNGGGTVENQSVAKNDKVAKPANPAKNGFVFEGWYANSSLTEKYDFDEEVTSSITLYAKWAEDSDLNPISEDWVNPFIDVKTSDWFYNDVAYVVTNGLFNGINSYTFGPDQPMTRAMFVTVLWRLTGSPEGNSVIFTDVPEDTWYSEAVAWATENDIVEGIGEGLFAPDTEVAREQIAAILWRYAKFAGIDVSSGEDTNILSYNDAFDVSEYAIGAMQWVCGSGIVSGKPGGLLDPMGTATRAEVAAILHRFMEVIK